MCTVCPVCPVCPVCTVCAMYVVMYVVMHTTLLLVSLTLFANSQIRMRSIHTISVMTV